MNISPQIKRLIKLAQRSEGYFITATRLSNGRLFSVWITFKFEKSDIPIAIKQIEKMVQPEIESGSIRSASNDGESDKMSSHSKFEEKEKEENNLKR